MTPYAKPANYCEVWGLRSIDESCRDLAPYPLQRALDRVPGFPQETSRESRRMSPNALLRDLAPTTDANRRVVHLRNKP
jgi:hypothetical protein